MASKFENVLSSEDIEYINNLPEVLVAKNKLENSNKVYFSICLTDSIRETLSQRFEIDFTGINQLPMRWIKEDTLPHIDIGSSHFENTYLVYLNNNSGNFIVDDESYNITENTGFKFSEGLLHKTVNTGIEPRLLIGPMSEKAFAVGGALYSYYSNKTNALSGISNNDENDQSTVTGNSGVRIAYAINGESTVIGTVTAGDIGPEDGWSVLDHLGNYLGNYSNGMPETALSTVNGQYYYLYPYGFGNATLGYYANETDALAGIAIHDYGEIRDISGNTDISGASGVRIAFYTGTDFVGETYLGNIGATTSWTVTDYLGNILGNFSNGTAMSSLGGPFVLYYLYPYGGGGGGAPCFLEGSQILCLVDEKETYLPIEQIRKGTLVKTFNSGYKMVHIIGKRDIPNFNDSNRIKDRLYKLTSTQYPALTSDLYLTGCHSTLVDSLTDDQKDEIKKLLGVVCVTEGKYRLPACIDNNAEPWQSAGTYTVWHFALDDENPRINFGVYANGGLIVETGSIRYLQGKANMELV